MQNILQVLIPNPLPGKDPREIDGRYYSAYWNMEYTVISINGDEMIVEWANSDITVDRKPWDWRRDRIVRGPRHGG